MSEINVSSGQPSVWKDVLLGEIRLLVAFGFYAEESDALVWKPSVPRSPLRMAMLRRISDASAAWSMGMVYRRMQRSLIVGFSTQSPEWDLFEREPVA